MLWCLPTALSWLVHTKRTRVPSAFYDALLWILSTVPGDSELHLFQHFPILLPFSHSFITIVSSLVSCYFPKTQG